MIEDINGCCYRCEHFEIRKYKGGESWICHAKDSYFDYMPIKCILGKVKGG